MAQLQSTNNFLFNRDLVLFNKAFDQNISIYDDIRLIKDSSLNKITHYRHKNNSLGLIFNLSGELHGKIICVLDIKNFSKKEKDLTNLKAIFSESMNILLGNFLTNLEKSSSIMSIVSTPKIIDSTNILSSFPSNTYISKYHFVVQYIMKLFTIEHVCNIYFYANPKNTKEV